MCRVNHDPIAVAILAKAPLPGLAKTRLIPALGAEGAAALQVRFITRAVTTAVTADIGPVTLWAAPDERHPVFQTLSARHGIAIARQRDGDLGDRMLAAIAPGPTLVIGTDCPLLEAEHLRVAAEVLREGIDVVVGPCEDGGYGLIGARRADPRLFAGIAWSTPSVMAQTRRALMRFGLSWREPMRLWDVDEPRDLERLARLGGAVSVT